jgi:hypothetical protein
VSGEAIAVVVVVAVIAAVAVAVVLYSSALCRWEQVWKNIVGAGTLICGDDNDNGKTAAEIRDAVGSQIGIP